MFSIVYTRKKIELTYNYMKHLFINMHSLDLPNGAMFNNIDIDMKVVKTSFVN